MAQIIRLHCTMIRVVSVMVLMGMLLALFQSVAHAISDGEKPLARLFDLIRMEEKVSPLHPIGNFENSTDPSMHDANMEYIRHNNDLLDKIRSDLGEQPLQWHLKSLSRRLLYVPENRPEYIALYESYCHQVIGEILAKTQLPNPYTHIITLADNPPPLQSPDGFYAYIVHNLTAEVRAEYEFRNTSEQSVVIALSGRHPSGEVGSYASFLSFDAHGNVVFTRDRFTLWQNNAQNPYTALMTPVEETLHVALRGSTEAAIRTAIEEKSVQSAREAKRIADEWISVEEAIVGGLVYVLLPPILEKQVGRAPLGYITRDIETKSGFVKYRYLKKGIQLVRDMGYKAAIHLYLDDPVAFRNLL